MDESRKPVASSDLLAAISELRGDLDEISSVAAGGMAEIFRAKQSSLNRFVAIKRLKRELLASAETKERFRREAKALATVLHQNVAHVYDFIEGPTDSFIVMEYIEGIDLSTVISRVGALSPDVAASIILGIARGLTYIHAHHLIHRDIKPSNIRLTSRGEVKLMDFGIVMDVESSSLTRPGVMVGSPSYLSPEQVIGDPISLQSDLFLLGICFYEMLTGTRPFKEEGGSTVFQRIRECNYIPVSEMRKGVPKPLVRMVERCLQKEPGERYTSSEEISEELEKFLGRTKSNRTADILLKFLDEEALLTPSMTYLEKIEPDRWFGDLPWAKALAISVVSLGVGVALGYFLPRHLPGVLPPPHYPPPSTTK